MTTSLVTGGSGFIGQHLVDQLLSSGQTVRVLDVEPPPTWRSDVDHIQGSITDRPTVREAMRGVRHLYHTAAIPHLWIPDPSLFQETNVVGTRIVFEEALRAGVERVVHTSSATVLIDGAYGRAAATLDERCQTEEGDLIGDYARSKWRAEKVALSYADRLQVTVVMPTLPLGPGDRHFTPPGRMLRDFVNGKNRAYTDCILNIVDVRDVAVGHRLACMRGRSGRRYILNQHSLPMLSFLECLESLTGRPMPKWRVSGSAALIVSAALELWSNLVSGRSPVAPMAGTLASLRPITFDNRLASRELGLPATPLTETLSDAIAWLVNEGHHVTDAADPELVLNDR